MEVMCDKECVYPEFVSLLGIYTTSYTLITSTMSHEDASFIRNFYTAFFFELMLFK